MCILWQTGCRGIEVVQENLHLLFYGTEPCGESNIEYVEWHIQRRKKAGKYFGRVQTFSWGNTLNRTLKVYAHPFPPLNGPGLFGQYLELAGFEYGPCFQGNCVAARFDPQEFNSELSRWFFFIQVHQHSCINTACKNVCSCGFSKTQDFILFECKKTGSYSRKLSVQDPPSRWRSALLKAVAAWLWKCALYTVRKRFEKFFDDLFGVHTWKSFLMISMEFTLQNGSVY